MVEEPLAVVVRARGHENVRCLHESTLEVTSDEYLTPAGDCIAAVGADRTPADLPSAFVSACQDAATEISARIAVGEHRETVTGRGDPDLSLESDRSFVCRTSEYVDERTVMVGADAAATDLDRDLVGALRAGGDATVTFIARPP